MKKKKIQNIVEVQPLFCNTYKICFKMFIGFTIIEVFNSTSILKVFQIIFPFVVVLKNPSVFLEFYWFSPEPEIGISPLTEVLQIRWTKQDNFFQLALTFVWSVHLLFNAAKKKKIKVIMMMFFYLGFNCPCLDPTEHFFSIYHRKAPHYFHDVPKYLHIEHWPT